MKCVDVITVIGFFMEYLNNQMHPLAVTQWIALPIYGV